MSFENDGAIAPETVTSTVTDAPAVIDAPATSPTTEVVKPEPGSAPADPNAKKLSGVSKRIDELTRRYREAERREERLLALLEGKPSDKQTQTNDAEPKESDFNSYGEYVRALARWEFRQEQKQSQKANEETLTKKRQQEHIDGLRTTFETKADKLREKHEDFDDVCFGDHVTITEHMALAIMDSDLGPEINYYLGSNPTEALRIARLGPYAAAREIGKLEAKLSNPQPQAKKPSNAPEPINPVSPNSKSNDSPGDKDSINDWMKKRRTEVRGK